MLFTLFFTITEARMNYKFICPECNKTVEVEMRISEYTNKGHICECGTELKRDVKDMGYTFDIRTDGFCGKCGN